MSLLLGLLVSAVGLDNPAGFPRFTFGNAELAGGLTLIPIMIGMFAVSEILRSVSSDRRALGDGAGADRQRVPRHVDAHQALSAVDPARQRARHRDRRAARRRRRHRGVDVVRDVEEILQASREKFGTGHVEGIVEAGAANNSALAGAWIPALVFGIPGDSITAIVIGVLYIKGLNPGPTIFMNNAVSHLRDLHRLHPREPADAAARHRRDQEREADAARAARAAACR